MTKAETTELAKRVSSQSGKITHLGKKVFNGHGDAIQAVKEQGDFNTKLLMRVIWFGATSMVLILGTLITILASVWVADRTIVDDPVPVEVEANAIGDSSDTVSQ